MSVPDYQLNPPDDPICEECGGLNTERGRLCFHCKQDWADVYADEAYTKQLPT